MIENDYLKEVTTYVEAKTNKLVGNKSETDSDICDREV
jgi:hypothetical protein